MSAKHNYHVNHGSKLNLSNLTNATVLALGKKPLRVRSDELVKFALNGIEHAVQLFSGRRHSGSGSTAMRFYHVYVNECDYANAMEVITSIVKARAYYA